MSNVFKKSYNNVYNSMGSFEGAGHGENYVDNVQEKIDLTIKKISEIGNTNKDLHYIKGDIAEPWHAGTTQIFAAAKGIKNIDTDVPRDTSPIDIRAYSPLEYLEAQLKYFKTPEATCKAISNPKYEELIKIVPSDQLEDIKHIAYDLYLKNLNTRPEMAQQYLDTYNSATERLNIGKAHSTPLTEHEALQIAKEIQKDNFNPDNHELNTLNYIQDSDIFRESGEAAFNAAILSAVLKASPHLFNAFKALITDGEFDISELKKAGGAAASGATQGALRGGISAAIVGSCKSGLLGESLKNIDPTGVAAATVVGMRAISNASKLYKGEISIAEFGERSIHDSFVVSVGMYGAALGQTIIPVPVLGAVIGNLVGSVLATVFYEGGKEIFFAPFIKSGASFLCIVKQDYTLPRDVLIRAGFDLIELDKIKLDTIKIDKIKLDTIELDTIDIRVLKRGLIKVNTIGYI